MSLIRLVSVTHGFDMNQRFQALPFIREGSELKMAVTTGGKRTPPGHYMLFIVNRTGVPSVAKILQIK